ncbi:class I SAM-dependent methyltransferase [Paenibacillus sinopodophylli]|uniref:class I SAM-dependent methyltransferase n=1 Tax=Paenibacillus sinopodophylli TaxID=1837342 RepID=UPI00110CFCC4|nr:class I SAM-dependent methyltransferase [Paenibacillus sinopodophylli]
MESLVYQIVLLTTAAVMLLALMSIVFVSWRNGISPMPSSSVVRREVLRLMKRLPMQGPLSDGVMIEAGSGWGSLALQLGRSFRGWRIIGLENSVIPLWISFCAAKLENRMNVSFTKCDLYTYCYRDVDRVVCYLYPGAMRRLSPLFREQLKPGAYVVSILFALPDWEPEQVMVCKDMYRTPIYLYKA